MLRHAFPAIEARMARDFDFKVEVQLALLKAHSSAKPANDAIRPSSLLDYSSSCELIEPRFMESDLTIERVAAVLSTAAPRGY